MNKEKFKPNTADIVFTIRNEKEEVKKGIGVDFNNSDGGLVDEKQINELCKRFNAHYNAVIYKMRKSNYVYNFLSKNK